jgi:nucleoside phosphorylase
MLHNVFLDFFNRDSREIYGLYSLPSETHIEVLVEALTVAAFLCGSHCILPPGFLAESGLGREALLNRRRDYIDERLVRLSMREYNIDALWEKKERQYAPFREKYRGLFDPKNHELLRRASHAIIPRSTNIADSILAGWEAAPDSNPVWRGSVRSLNSQSIERIRRIPSDLFGEGIAVTWPAILAQIKEPFDVRKLRPVLQNVYFSAYVAEYGLKVITNLPYTSHPFIVTGGDLGYDYEALKAALGAGGLWGIVRRLSAVSMLGLRSTSGYVRFRETFDLVAATTDQLVNLSRTFTLAADAARPTQTAQSIVERYSGRLTSAYGIELTRPELDEIADRLTALAQAALEIANDIKRTEMRAEPIPRRSSVSLAKSKHVAIFVALEMERRLLVERWRLQGAGIDQVWRGTVARAQISVFSRDEMGRVPAAIATMDFLSKERPDFLIIAGIAGGFAAEGVALGHVLVPASIVDLASRKIFSDARTIPSFRPREFQTDDRLAKYLRASFAVRDWESQAIREAEWPDGLRPAIKYGPMVSLDEVVTNSDYVDLLRQYWPKLLGIEMEAGGVCAAAETFGIKAAVVRGVSDLADPSKSDTEWRRRAMKTVAHLIESLDFDVFVIS